MNALFAQQILLVYQAFAKKTRRVVLTNIYG